MAENTHPGVLLTVRFKSSLSKEELESLDEYIESDLRKSIPETYEIVGTPRLEAISVVDVLRT